MPSHILLIDDEPALRHDLSEFLTIQGYQVSCAATAEEALPHAPSVDLAVCDLRLGNTNGIDVIRELRSRRSDLRVIVLSGHPSISALHDAHSLGVITFLTKPTPWPDLLRIIDGCLGKKPGRVFLFPASLKQKFQEIVPYLGEVVAAEPADGPRLKTLFSEAQPWAAIFDVGAPETPKALNQCKSLLGDSYVFLACREEDFSIAKQLLEVLPSAICLAIDGSQEELLKTIKTHFQVWCDNVERVRKALLDGGCSFARPLRVGHYCTVAGRCPNGEAKAHPVSVENKIFECCPRPAFRISSIADIGLLLWRGTPDEQAIAKYRADALDFRQKGKTHLMIDCRGLNAAPFNLLEVLADLHSHWGGSGCGRIDVINVPRELMPQFQDAAHFFAGVGIHGNVMIQLVGSTPTGGRDVQRTP